MKRTLLFLSFFLAISFNLISQVQNVTFEVVPNPFQEDETITITASNVNPSLWGVTDIYLWAWSSAGGVEQDAPNNGIFH